MAIADSFTHQSAAFDRVPLFGAITRKLADSDGDLPLILLLVVALAWGGAVAIWGIPALYLPAVVASPLAILGLVGLTRG